MLQQDMYKTCIKLSAINIHLLIWKGFLETLNICLFKTVLLTIFQYHLSAKFQLNNRTAFVKYKNAKWLENWKKDAEYLLRAVKCI